MWPFTSKPVSAPALQPIPDVIQTLSGRYLDMETRLKALELSEKNFRDKVLRKVQTLSEKPKDSLVDRPGIIGYGDRVRSDISATEESRREGGEGSKNDS